MFSTLFINPLYNGFVFILDIIPGGDAGIAIILATIAVSLIIFPLSKKSLASQAKMKEYEGELKEIKNRYAHNREEQARAMLVFYREKGINPLAGLFLALIQLPIIIALYYVFARTGLPDIDVSRLYSFVSPPQTISFIFLGLIDISQKSLILALVAALAQFVQGWFSPALAAMPAKKNSDGKPSFEESFAAGMRLQVRYFLPGIIFLISYQYSGVIALYFATRSLSMFFQELFMRGKNPNQKIDATRGDQINH